MKVVAECTDHPWCLRHNDIIIRGSRKRGKKKIKQIKFSVVHTNICNKLYNKGYLKTNKQTNKHINGNSLRSNYLFGNRYNYTGLIDYFINFFNI